MINQLHDFAIRVSNLSKVYARYPKPSHLITELLTRNIKHEKFYALNDISFEVKRGEVVGIIGKNGAGKSTLLRIIAGTLDATEGVVDIRGKVSTLMILGTGFNLKLSGRENITLGGLYLGLTKSEIEEKVASIIEFSGIEEFIDQPCKNYSTGMLQRLAFSIAISIEPDILIIDEILSVGDAVFVAKCNEKIKKITKSGTTVLLVSHSMETIYNLCHRAILLENGKIVMSGAPRKIGVAYLDKMFNEMKPIEEEKKYETKEIENIASSLLTRKETGVLDHTTEIEITNAVILNENLKNVDELREKQDYTIRIYINSKKDFDSLTVGYIIQHTNGSSIYGTSTAVQGINFSAKKDKSYFLDFTFHCLLKSGEYYLFVGVAELLGELREHYYYNMLHYIPDILKFTVSGSDFESGFINLESELLLVDSMVFDPLKEGVSA